MKNFRYLITVLALINAGLVAQAAAAPTTTDARVGSTTTTPASNKIWGTD